MKNRRHAFCWGLVLVGILLVPVTSAVGEPKDYTGHRLVRVDIGTQAELDLLLSISPDIWSDYIGIGPLNARIPPEDMDDLIKSGLNFRVLQENLQVLVDAERLSVGRGTWDAYMDLDQIVGFINGLAAARPDLCEVISIGQSLNGEDIWVLHIAGTGSSPKPAVFYHSLLHSREWLTAPVVLYLADHLVGNYDTDPAVAALVDGLDIYLAPCVNPDGYRYTWTSERYWRKNRRNNGGGSWGVDLNRNWDYQWGYDNSGSSPNPSSEIYRGTSPFSEPETTALSNFIISRPDILAYMDYHAFTQLILWPWGYDCLGGPSEPDRTTYANLGNTMQSLIQSVHGEYYEPGPICETIYAANGGSADWAYGAQGAFGFTMELRPSSGGLEGFSPPASQILPTCEENLPAILHLTEWALDQVGMAITFPNGLPDPLTPGTPAVFDVEIVPQYDSLVPGSPTLHYRYAGGSFQTSPLTLVSGDLYQATLPAASCTDAPEYYFSAQGTGTGNHYQPADAPASSYTAVVGEFVAVIEDNFDADPGWTTEGNWAFGTPTGGGGEYGGPDPTSGYTGNNVYGYNLAGDYPNNLSERHLTSPAIDCTNKSGVRLNFWRWLGVEQPVYDHAYVRVSNNGTNWTTVWENGVTITDGSWVEMDLDISAVADGQPTVYLRWTMGTTDSAWRYCGWNIDDVKLTTFQCVDVTCPQPADGDMDGGGDTNGADIQVFVDGILGNPTQEVACRGDFSGDMVLNVADIPGMVNALLAP